MSKTQIALRVFLPFAAGVLLSYFFRSINAVLESYLRADMPGVDRQAIGVITGAFFLAIALFQIPLGVILDRFGPRRVESLLMVLAAAGCIVFALADDVVSLFAGRALIGLGMAAGLMAALNAFALWFPADRLPALNGWAMAVGSLGTILATVPVQWALTRFDWREIFYCLSALTLLLALTIFMVVPERSGHALGRSSMIGGLAQIWRSRTYWRLMPFFVCGQGTLVAVQTLWIAPWLLDARGYDDRTKSLFLLLMALTQFASLASLGHCVRFLKRFGLTPVAIAALSLSLGLTTLLVIAANPGWLPTAPMLVLLSMGASGSTLFFAAITQKFPVQLTGRLVTSLNMSIFGMVFVAQSLIGFLVNRLTSAGGFPLETAYAISFAALAAAQIVPLSLLFFLRPVNSAGR